MVTPTFMLPRPGGGHAGGGQNSGGGHFGLSSAESESLDIYPNASDPETSALRADFIRNRSDMDYQAQLNNQLAEDAWKRSEASAQTARDWDVKKIPLMIQAAKQAGINPILLAQNYSFGTGSYSGSSSAASVSQSSRSDALDAYNAATNAKNANTKLFSALAAVFAIAARFL